MRVRPCGNGSGARAFSATEGIWLLSVGAAYPAGGQIDAGAGRRRGKTQAGSGTRAGKQGSHGCPPCDYLFGGLRRGIRPLPKRSKKARIGGVSAKRAVSGVSLKNGRIVQNQRAARQAQMMNECCYFWPRRERLLAWRGSATPEPRPA